MPPRFLSSLAVATAGLTFTLVILGAVVRVTGSGMGCPDWPLCHGQWLPPWDRAAILEWLHRLVAAIVSGATLALVGTIALTPALRARMSWPAWLLVGALLAQIALGAYTVAQSNSPPSVAGHLVMGYVFLGALVSLAWRATTPARPERGDPRVAAAFLVAIGVVLLQTFFGGLVAAGFAGRACPDFPTCGGAWLPPFEGLAALQMGHRYAALAVVLAVGGAVGIAARSPVAAARAWAVAAAGLLAVQLVIGFAAVLGPFTLAIRVAHQVGAACLFVACWLAFEAARPVRTREAAPLPDGSEMSA